MDRLSRLLFLLPLLLLISCGSSVEMIEEEEPVGFSPWYTIDESLEPDPVIESRLQTWRKEHNTLMGEPVTTAEGPFRLQLPESSLGNLTTDIFGTEQVWRCTLLSTSPCCIPYT